MPNRFGVPGCTDRHTNGCKEQEEDALINKQTNMHRRRGAQTVRSHLDQVVVDPCAIGQEEAAARRQAVKEEELLLSTKQAVVPLLRLLHSVLVGLHAVLVWEGDAIHTLHANPQQITIHRNISDNTGHIGNIAL